MTTNTCLQALLAASVLLACAVPHEPEGADAESVFICDAVRVCGGTALVRGIPFRSTTARDPVEAAHEYRAWLLAGDCVEVVMADAKCRWPSDDGGRP
jgi:hypothetical protein